MRIKTAKQLRLKTQQKIIKNKMSKQNSAKPATQKFYRVKKETLSTMFEKTTSTKQKNNEFEIYLIQEGIKQILFAQGNKQVEMNDGWEYSIPKEMIQFLLDHDAIELYESTTTDYKTNTRSCSI